MSDLSTKLRKMSDQERAREHHYQADTLDEAIRAIEETEQDHAAVVAGGLISAALALEEMPDDEGPYADDSGQVADDWGNTAGAINRTYAQWLRERAEKEETR